MGKSDWDDHDKGDDECAGCAQGVGMPEPHACGGLLHAQPWFPSAGDEEAPDTLSLWCDKCGATGTREVPQRNAVEA
jgi:hypothetical protein